MNVAVLTGHFAGWQVSTHPLLDSLLPCGDQWSCVSPTATGSDVDSVWPRVSRSRRERDGSKAEGKRRQVTRDVGSGTRRHGSNGQELRCGTCPKRSDPRDDRSVRVRSTRPASSQPCPRAEGRQRLLVAPGPVEFAPSIQVTHAARQRQHCSVTAAPTTSVRLFSNLTRRRHR